MRSRVPTSQIKKRDEARMITLEAPKEYHIQDAAQVEARSVFARQGGPALLGWSPGLPCSVPVRASITAV
jgi:hypothetical protein